jgi:capping protein beta
VTVNKDNTHVSNLGQQIEKVENSMRATIETIYFGRTKDIVGDIRKKVGVKADEQSRSMQQAIRGDLGK